MRSYLREWCELSAAIDIATGYFEIGALLALEEKWQAVEHFRILLGDEVSLRAKRAFSEGLKNIAQRLDASLEAEKAKDDFLAGVPAIVAAIRAGKIECRVYRQDKFHAKACITHARSAVVGSSALVGSSNFTFPGLCENVELNVRISSSAEVGLLQAWYERHWQDAEDITPDILRTLERHTDPRTPFEVWFKALHEFCRGHELTPDEWDTGESVVFPQLARYQQKSHRHRAPLRRCVSVRRRGPGQNLRRPHAHRALRAEREKERRALCAKGRALRCLGSGHPRAAARLEQRLRQPAALQPHRPAKERRRARPSPPHPAATEAQLIAAHPEWAGERGARCRIIFWNFLPPDELNDLLRIYEKVSHKVLTISKTLGLEGGTLLHPDQQFDPVKEFNERYDGKIPDTEELLLEYRRLQRDHPTSPPPSTSARSNFSPAKRIRPLAPKPSSSASASRAPTPRSSPPRPANSAGPTPPASPSGSPATSPASASPPPPPPSPTSSAPSPTPRAAPLSTAPNSPHCEKRSKRNSPRHISAPCKPRPASRRY